MKRTLLLMTTLAWGSSCRSNDGERGGALDASTEGEAEAESESEAESEAEAEGQESEGEEKFCSGPIPAGCWAAVEGTSCEWDWDSDAPVGCAAAWLACCPYDPGDPASSYACATDNCWQYCTPMEGDASPDAGVTADPLDPGQWISCNRACVDGAARPLTRISVFPCSVCAEIPNHTVAASKTCGLGKQDAGPDAAIPFDAGAP